MSSKADTDKLTPARESDAIRPALDAAIARFQGRRPVRAGSLIITVFGDAIASRGGAVSLASLSEMLAPFGLSDSLIRTTLSRQTADGWFVRQKVGRRSVYALSRSGRQRVEEATRRIYTGPGEGWAGEWTVVILPSDDPGVRERFKSELGWIGFGALAPNVMVHAAADETALQSVLAENGNADQVLVIRGHAGGAKPETLRRVTEKGWNFDELRNGYAEFIDTFEPALAALRTVRPEPRDCLTLRLVLIHEYRRVMLHDPLLPPALLSDDWIGWDAYRLCAEVYRAVVRSSEAFLDRHADAGEGPLPPADERIWSRFSPPA